MVVKEEEMGSWFGILVIVVVLVGCFGLLFVWASLRGAHSMEEDEGQRRQEEAYERQEQVQTRRAQIHVVS